MKASAFVASVIVTAAFLITNAVAFAQQGCEFNIVGMWEASTPDKEHPTVYRFTADGTVAILSRDGTDPNSELAETATYRYKLDNAKAPKTIEFTASDGSSPAPLGSMKISKYDDATFTTEVPDSESARWVKINTQRFFVVFAARGGTLRVGGPAFAMLIKTNGSQPEVQTFGLYLAKDATGKEEDHIVGPIPDKVRDQFMNEPQIDSDTMLRLELSSAAFERGLHVMQVWQKRAREHLLLYEVPYLNNMVFLEDLAESLNNCTEKIHMNKLTWDIHDQIISKHNLTQAGFYYIKELRQLNESQHVRDDAFHQRVQGAGGPSFANGGQN
jgi:hypothetical protein